MTIKEIKLSSGFSCCVCDTFIAFSLRDGDVIIPTITFCVMDFKKAKNWLSAVGIDINRDDFRSIYFDGGLSLANLLNHGLIEGNNDAS